VTTGWREGVERDLGRLTAELAQRAAAIDDAYAAIDALSGWGRVEDLEAAVAGLRDDHATLLRVVDERELRAFASEGRLAALETAAEACSERLRTLEQAAMAAADESLADGRAHATRRLVEEAERKGANAIFAFRFDTSQLGTGTEVCAYGTAVRARRAS
jgi:uncharacterized protein YbjQ (UPF0145 family)